jgi:superfamily I DNA/RNA helicase
MAMLKRTTRVALFDAESHCYMVPVALMALSRTVNLVTVRVAESHSHPFRHPSEILGVSRKNSAAAEMSGHASHTLSI